MSAAGGINGQTPMQLLNDILEIEGVYHQFPEIKNRMQWLLKQEKSELKKAFVMGSIYCNDDSIVFEHANQYLKQTYDPYQ